ncbi:unnamed protein product [Lepeophtheirus salmonis]|uniref:(salmon louse) hypothetical protein n=1 Tax=Lepeophtheirus salmonis TaxID=72036 RepID=A0A7R8H5J7_LEPSM|nr:unnamed protein product [Lepeophtheirus salmonis]CAF2868942.1 unnamed protein product [Lepeophtheirus salmonis]
MDSQTTPEGGVGEIISMQSLLNRLTVLHVSAGKETDAHVEAISQYEEQSKDKLKALWKELEGMEDMSDFQRRLIHRNIELEMNSIKLKGTLKKLYESIGEYQKQITSNSSVKDDFSKLKYTLITKQADEIKEAQCDISCLIARNRTFSSSLESFYLLLKSLENQFMERYNDFNQLPVHVYSFTNMVEPSLDNLHLHNMSIHRFSNHNDLPSPKVMDGILSELNLPITVAPGKKFLSHVIDLKRENDFYTNWLKINGSNDFYSDLYKIEGMAKELQELKNKTKKEHIPNVQAFMKNFEEYEESFDKLKAELEIW